MIYNLTTEILISGFLLKTRLAHEKCYDFENGFSISLPGELIMINTCGNNAIRFRSFPNNKLKKSQDTRKGA